MKHYLHIFISDHNELLLSDITSVPDLVTVNGQPFNSVGYELVTVLTCYDKAELGSIDIDGVWDLIDRFELQKYAEKDIMELGTVSEPPIIITRDHVLSLVDEVSYATQGLTTICNMETIHKFQIVGQSHCQYAPKNSPSLGREMALDDAIRQLFDMEVYRSKVYHATK